MGGFIANIKTVSYQKNLNIIKMEMWTKVRCVLIISDY